MAEPFQLTEYHTQKKIFGLSLNYVPSIQQYFLNSWEMNLGLPLFVIIVMTLSYLVFISIVAPFLHIHWLLILLYTILFILFFVSYIEAVLEGPGYLPFYYPLVPNNNNYTQFEYLSGMVTTEDQLKTIQRDKLPKRAHYCKSARRIVIRPDHYCDWIAGFVGKKNHKLFYLFNFYGFIYISILLILIILTIKTDVENNKFPLIHIILFPFALLGVFFAMFTMVFCMASTYEISQNITDLENLKNITPDWDTSSCIGNWEEICGSCNKWYLWPVPVGTFHNIDSYSLVEWPHEMTTL